MANPPSTAPAFDPSKPFTRVSGPAASAPTAPAFDPSKPFTKSSVPNAAQAGAVAATPPAAPAAPQRNPLSMDEFMKTAESWARGISLGWSDDASAALAATILKAKGDPKAFGDLYKAFDTYENQRIDQAEKEAPARKFGEFIGGLQTPGFRQLGGWIGSADTMLGRIARAAGVGSAAGAVGGAGYAKPGEKEQGAGIGAGIGAVAGPLVDRAAAFIGPRITQAAQYLRNNGVTSTIGQNVGGWAKAAEEKASSIPLLGDLIKRQQRAAIDQFNRAAYNQVLAPLNQQVAANAPIGNEGFAALDHHISAQYNRVLPHVTLDPINDPQFLAEFSPIEQEINLLPRDQQQMVRDTINHYFVNRLREEPMSGTEFKRAESIISQRARNIAKNPNSSMWDNEVASLYRETLSALRNSLERTNPEFAGQLQPINQAYANLIRVQKAVSRIGAKDGIFTPAQLLSAVKQTSPEKQFARGQAPLQELAQAGDATLSNKYPDSGSIGRLLLGMGVGGAISPKAAAGVGAASIPYALPRGWNASPFAQGSAALLRQTLPGVAAQAGGEVPKYIGPQ